MRGNKGCGVDENDHSKDSLILAVDVLAVCRQDKDVDLQQWQQEYLVCDEEGVCGWSVDDFEDTNLKGSRGLGPVQQEAVEQPRLILMSTTTSGVNDLTVECELRPDVVKTDDFVEIIKPTEGEESGCSVTHAVRSDGPVDNVTANHHQAPEGNGQIVVMKYFEPALARDKGGAEYQPHGRSGRYCDVADVGMGS